MKKLNFIHFFNNFLLIVMKSIKILFKVTIAIIFYQTILSFFVFGAYLFYSSLSGSHTLMWNVLYLSISLLMMALSTPAITWMFDKIADELKDNSDRLIR